jgi:hypothetical protein
LPFDQVRRYYQKSLTELVVLSREEIIKEQLGRAVKDILEQLPWMAEVFRNPTYDLNKTVENEMDFFLGAVLGEILERYTQYLLNKQIKPSAEEFAWINQTLFSRANEFKDLIRKIVQV